MSSVRLNSSLDTSHVLPRPYKDPGVVVGSLTGIHNAMVKCLFTASRSYTHKGFFWCPNR
jgi:hypothetical protein